MRFTFAFRLHLDLYVKLLKQVAKHFSYFSYVITNILNELKLNGRNSQLYWINLALTSLLHAILRFIKNFAFHTSMSAIYYWLVYLKVLFSFKPYQKATCADSETQ